jgi:hypothetical protein
VRMQLHKEGKPTDQVVDTSISVFVLSKISSERTQSSLRKAASGSLHPKCRSAMRIPAQWAKAAGEDFAEVKASVFES